METIKYCRNCDYWKEKGQWRGVCGLDHFTKPRWSQSASANGCPDYKDKDEARRLNGRVKSI